MKAFNSERKETTTTNFKIKSKQPQKRSLGKLQKLKSIQARKKGEENFT